MNNPKARLSALSRLVCNYLKANPEEELTRTDIGTKFDVAPSAVDSLLTAAVGRGELICARNDDDGIVWRLGLSATTTPAPFSAGERAAKAARLAKVKTTLSIDLASIVVEKGVVYQPRPKRTEQWNSLFSSMDEVGDSFQIPLHGKHALARAAAEYRKVAPAFRFSIRNVSDTHCRIWRKA